MVKSYVVMIFSNFPKEWVSLVADVFLFPFFPSPLISKHLIAFGFRRSILRNPDTQAMISILF